MIYSSFDDSIRRINPVAIDIPPKPRTLEALIEKYSMLPISAQSAHMALAEREAICRECDEKGFHTENDLAMMDYLWHIRNEVVTHILASERVGRETANLHAKAQAHIRGLSIAEREEMYARNNR